jgi:DNA-binding IclR family transcriptional regulator
VRRELTSITGRGYALDQEEAAPGVSCVAVPVLGGDGCAVAAISVSYPAASASGNPRSLIAPLRETAAAIAKSLVIRRSLAG